MKKSSKEVKHEIGTRIEWLAARLKLLKAEKEHTRRGDELALMRQELPWVRVDKSYRFETDEGKVSLSDLFRGRSQLLIYHLMFGPDYTAACPSCSAIADGFNGFQIHLANHDVMLWAVSRAPLAKLQGYKRRMGWTFPWASSFGGDFNFDYSVGFTEEQQREGGIEYNYHREDALKPSSPSDQNVWGTGVDLATFVRERPGVSAFVLEDGVVYHTYSTYARGVDALWGMWQWLDRAPTKSPPRFLTDRSPPFYFAVRTAWPATRPANSLLKFRAYPLNVLPSSFRFLDGDNPADPLIAREWRNILHFARAAGSEMRTSRKSAGTLCTAPGEIAFLVMDFILHRSS